MHVVTTRDGQHVELKPCPPWCTGDHFGPEPPLLVSDGFHHRSWPIRIVTSEFDNLVDRKPMVVQVSLTSWVASLNADPAPARIELEILESAFSSVELIPDLARRVAEALIELSDQASGPASG